MIASIITALYLMGIVGGPQAVIFLVVCGVLLLAAEIAVTSFGVLALNGILALFVGYSIHNGADTVLGLPLDWSLLFGIAFVELVFLVISIFIILHYRGKKATTGVESMIGEKAHVVEWDGQKGTIRIQGENWKAQSEKPLELSKDEKVTVTAVNDLTLTIKGD